MQGFTEAPVSFYDFDFCLIPITNIRTLARYYLLLILRQLILLKKYRCSLIFPH